MMQEIDGATNFVSRYHRLGCWNVGIEGGCVNGLEMTNAGSGWT